MTVPLWKRLGIRTFKSDIRDEVVQKLETAVELKAKVGKEFIIGFNSVCKLIEKVTTINASKHLLLFLKFHVYDPAIRLPRMRHLLFVYQKKVQVINYS